jgi:hypothetical protein
MNYYPRYLMKAEGYMAVSNLDWLCLFDVVIQTEVVIITIICDSDTNDRRFLLLSQSPVPPFV